MTPTQLVSAGAVCLVGGVMTAALWWHWLGELRRSCVAADRKSAPLPNYRTYGAGRN